MKTTFAILLTLAVIFTPTFSFAESASTPEPESAPAAKEEKFKATPDLVKSIVYLKLYFSDEERKNSNHPFVFGSAGTAWFFNSPKYLVTIGHVIEQHSLSKEVWKEAELFHKKDKADPGKTTTIKLRLSETVVCLGENLVILELEKEFPDACMLKIRGGIRPLDKGVETFSLAYCEGKLRLATGTYHGMGDTTGDPRQVGFGLFELCEGNNRLTLDYGASGAPIFDSDGCVTGVVSVAFSQALRGLGGGGFRVGSSWGNPTNMGVVLPVPSREMKMPEAQKK